MRLKKLIKRSSERFFVWSITTMQALTRLWTRSFVMTGCDTDLLQCQSRQRFTENGDSGDRSERLALKRRSRDEGNDSKERKKYKVGMCFSFQEGKCTRKDCRFTHRCDKCNSPDLGAADCKQHR